MGIISAIQAIFAIQKIRNGGVASLSIAQVANNIISLSDAQKNLPKEKDDQVRTLFYEMQKCTTKMPMDMETYMDVALRIIKNFDKIAPYEKYSGGNEIEYSFFMDDVREHDYKL